MMMVWLSLACATSEVVPPTEPSTAAPEEPVLSEHDRLALMHRELYEIFKADQGDRTEPVDWDVVTPRDTARRARVAEILAAGGASNSIDYYYAAMVYQHGPDLEDARKARELALQALTVEPVYKRARWLAAASEDRILMRENKPQKWGTQSTQASPDAPWTLYEVDPTTTDAQRAEWDVPPLAELQSRIAEKNAHPPAPSRPHP
jgi:hypothetical protein